MKIEYQMNVTLEEEAIETDYGVFRRTYNKFDDEVISEDENSDEDVTFEPKSESNQLNPIQLRKFGNNQDFRSIKYVGFKDMPRLMQSFHCLYKALEQIGEMGILKKRGPYKDWSQNEHV